LHEGDACEEIPFSTAKAGPTESEKQERIAQLTPREYDLYLLLLEGFTLKESAERLLIKYSTANTHMSGVYRKLGVKSRAQLIINYRYVSIENTRSPM
jgi:DNA-binding CsgD family transcriptional regulator